MNAIYRLALTGFVAAMIAGGSAFASDWEWATFPTVQTSVTYCRPVEKETTVAINSHGKAVGRAAGKTRLANGAFTDPRRRGAPLFPSRRPNNVR